MKANTLSYITCIDLRCKNWRIQNSV